MSSLPPTVKHDGLVTLGLDPHPGSHTAAALNMDGRLLAEITVGNDPEGLARLESWSEQFPHRQWAVEGVGNLYIYPWVNDLLARGELIYNISPAMTAQYRSRRGKKKTDPIDAANVARALLANPDLPPFVPGAHQRELQELTRS